MEKTTLAACLVILFLPLTASAYSLKSGSSVYVPKDEIIEGSLYAAGSDLTIEGRVTGDVICAGQSVNISGEVAGDVICAGQIVHINSQIGGNLRLAGETINFNGQVARNAMFFGAAIAAAASSSIGWDLLVLGNTFASNGQIGRDLHGRLAKADLAGPIGKNVNLHFGQSNGNDRQLVIAGAAKIGGDVKYTSDKNAIIENNAVITGQITHSLPAAMAKKPYFISLYWWWGNLIAVFSSLVVGLVLISLWREPIIKITDLMLNKIGASLGWGILILLLTPLLAIMLLITIIGIPLSLILTLLWLIAIYISKILAGIVIGRSLLSSFMPQPKNSLILAMSIGVVIICLLAALPLVGRPLFVFATLWGLGGIILTLKLTLKK